MVTVSGIGIRDPYFELLLLQSTRADVHSVILPPGRHLADCVSELATSIQHSSECHVVPLLAEACTPLTFEGWSAAMAERFEWPVRTVTDEIEFATEYHDQLQGVPNVVVLGVPRALAGAADLLTAFARALVRIAKDEPGYLSVLLLIEGGPDVCADDSVGVWPALGATLDPPALIGRGDGLRERSWRTYRALRLFWEAAGQPGALEELDARVELHRAPSLPDRADQQIDAALEREWTCPSDSRVWFEKCYEEHLIPTARTAMLRTGMLSVLKVSEARALGSGFAWRPPFSETLWITPNAARHLAGALGVRNELAALGLTADDFVRVTSSNTMVPTWVLGLTSVVERHLLGEVARDRSCVEQLQRASGSAEWTWRRRVAERFAYHKGGFAAFDADFGDLIQVAREGGAAFDVRVSEAELRDIKDIRNQCAHLRPVGWVAVSTVLGVLERIVEAR